MADRYDEMKLTPINGRGMELELEALGVTPTQYAALDGRVQANTDSIGVLDGRVVTAETAVTELSDGLDARYTKDETDGLLALKANKQQEAWITPTLLNGATGTLKYRKNEFGIVELTGYIDGPTGLPLFKFPSGYRLDSDIPIQVVGGAILQSVVIARAQINRSGDFYVHTPGGISVGHIRYMPRED